MQRSLPVLMALVLLFSTVGWSADLEKGKEAYEKEDYETALRELKPLAEKGHAQAQVMLGGMYRDGEGVPQNDKTAATWYTLAADQGDVDAQANLGFMYHEGKGVPKDSKTAVKWYRLAAERGNADAQYNLGLMYKLGNGVPPSYVYAHMWHNIAASKGHKGAVKTRDLLAKAMTPAQIEKAQDLAVECVEKNFKGCD